MTQAYVRETGLEDAEEISRLHVAAWRETYADILPHDFLASLDRATFTSPAAWRERITRQPPWRGVLAAGAADELCGFIGYRALEPNVDGYRGEIAQIYLLRQSQGYGLGTTMMKWAARNLAADGLTPFLLWVLVDNAPAHGFYRRLGGTPLGRQKLTLGGKEVEEQAYGWAGPEALLSPSRHPPAA